MATVQSQGRQPQTRWPSAWKVARAAMAAVIVALSPVAMAQTSTTGDSNSAPTSIAPGWNDANIAWRDYVSGMAEAARTGKPVLVIVHTTWCPHCKRYARLFQDASVVESARKFVMIMIDRDREPDLNIRLGPGSQTYVPRTLFLRPDGSLIANAVSIHPKFPHLIDNGDTFELLAVMGQALDDKAAGGKAAGIKAPGTP
jgi:thiol-disulfide isomerase/thioredoxin